MSIFLSAFCQFLIGRILSKKQALIHFFNELQGSVYTFIDQKLNFLMKSFLTLFLSFISYLYSTHSSSSCKTSPLPHSHMGKLGVGGVLAVQWGAAGGDVSLRIKQVSPTKGYGMRQLPVHFHLSA